MSLSAILGDIAGSRFERSKWIGNDFANARLVSFANTTTNDPVEEIRATDFPLFHKDCFVTDDSYMTLAVMDWIVHGGDLAKGLKRMYRQAPDKHLFGKYFRAWAETQGEDTPCGSVGNGAAMRVCPVAYVASTEEEALELAKKSAIVTHVAREAVEGAQALALAVFLARCQTPKEVIEGKLRELIPWDWSKPLDRWRQTYEFTSSSKETVPVAWRAFAESSSLEETLRKAISVGGDTDTNACMAGGLAGAFWGQPKKEMPDLGRYLDHDSQEIIKRFEQKTG